jgi:transcriptional regulator with XRE-family HTH domain
METRLASLFRERREARALTRPALSRLSGVPAPTIEAWERGSIKSPNLVHAARLARALGISPEELVEAALPHDEADRFAELMAAGPGATLAQARAAMGLDVDQMAAVLRARPSDIEAWEAGKAMPQPALERLVTILGARLGE